MSKYLLGLVNALGQFEPIGLEVRTLKEAKSALSWQRKGGFHGADIGTVWLTEEGKARVTLCNDMGKPVSLGIEGHPLTLANSGYKQEAFAAFVATLEDEVLA